LALREGIGPQTLERALGEVRQLDQVLAIDRRQSEYDRRER
jgi:hypothetical protein